MDKLSELAARIGKTYKEGEVVFRQGEAGDTMYILHEGTLAVIREKDGAGTVVARLNKGDVVVGNVGSPNHMQYTMVGDTVNMAHRLVEMAARHEIILSQSVLDGLSGPVETLPIERLPPAAIKGKEGLHTFYRVIT